jgi:penicillin-binding protein 1A
MQIPIFSTIVRIFAGSLRLIKLLGSTILTIAAVSTLLVLIIYILFARGLPDIKTLDDYHPPVISEVFASDGTKIGEFWTECRIFTPYEEIPKKVVQAFVDSEDARFFEHKGVDVRSIMRAFIANLQAGSVTQGGSTITQQITRSLLLTRERTVSRKVKEAILATRLERHLSKEQILTLYLNQIYLGNRAYGVAAAARNYFHKDLKDLTLGQIALIAGLPTAPTNFSPVNNPEEARKRQMHALGRMVEADHITDDEMKAALAESFDIYAAGVDKSFNVDEAAYFTEHVRRIVKDKYGDDFLYNKGLKIYTTLDLPMQKAAYATIRNGIEKLDLRHGFRGPIAHVDPSEITKKAMELAKKAVIDEEGEIIQWPPTDQPVRYEPRFTTGKAYEAVVVGFGDRDTIIQIGDTRGTIRPDGIKWARPFATTWVGYEGAQYVADPKTILKIGDVILARRLEDGTFSLAQYPLVESALFSLDPHTGFIKAMIGGYDFKRSEFNRATQALRQPGSSFKPFIYSSALDKGYTFDTTILDAPITYEVGGREKIWSPKNYGGGYKGPTSFRSAIQFSRNVPTVKIAYDIGIHYITAYARKMGLTSPIDKYLSMALGSNGVYLNEMVEAYSTFANMGMRKPQIAIMRIEDSQGAILESYMPDTSLIRPSDENKEENSSIEKADGSNVKDVDLNPALFREGMAAIEKDGLILTDLELKTLYGAQIPSGYTITPQTAYLMVNLLKAVVEGGTGTRVKALGRPVAGKTGTTNDETDTWFIGFVPDLAAGIWMGFDEIKPIGKGLTGGTVVAPVFLDFMKIATKDLAPKDFDKPSGFPSGDIMHLAGGSALFGARPSQDLTFGGADRAGRFFEEDLEEGGGYAPPPPQQEGQPQQQPAPGPSEESPEDTF